MINRIFLAVSPELPTLNRTTDDNFTDQGRYKESSGQRDPAGAHLELREEGLAGVEVIPSVRRLEAGEHLVHLRQLWVHGGGGDSLELGSSSRSLLQKTRLSCGLGWVG
jgi:hypothetical protein